MDSNKTLNRQDKNIRGTTKMICPNCRRIYKPKLIRNHPEIVIQEEYPEATPEEREQLISGICSKKCWDEYLGKEEDDL